jgi:mRNA-degrading endonuclease RelE of RelBE toxin-antitoxin system
MAYVVRWTKTFEKVFSKLSPDVQERYKTLFVKIQEDPYAHGRPLGFSWFRELKCLNFRVYYLIQDEQIILLLDMSRKKDQHQVINAIREHLHDYKDNIKKYL